MRVGQNSALDEISASIGELKAYTHEHRHGVNNVSAKIDALGHDVGRRLERVEQKLGERIDAIERKLADRIDSTERELGRRVETIDADVKSRFDATCKRIDMLETDKVRRDGARGLLAYVIDKWPSLTAAAGAVAMFLKRMARPVRKRFVKDGMMVCINVSGLKVEALAKMDIRAVWSS